MQPDELERYLHEHIPMSSVMGVSVVSANPELVILRAPLAPNINHRSTVFGGSASAVAILAAWSLLHLKLRAEGIPNRLVIQRNTMEYEQPIPGEFNARASIEQPEQWLSFTRLLERRGRARIVVSSLLEFGGHTAGRLSGEFVAFAGAGEA